MSNPTKKALLAAIRESLLSIKASLHVQMVSALADCLYEVYVFGLVSDAIGRKGAALEVRDGNGRTQRLLLRRKPGRIHGDPKFGFVHVARAGQSFELHTDLMVAGRSGTPHEIDVALLDASACARARSGQSDPGHKGLRVAVECKRYATPLPLRVGREYAGLLQEIKLKQRAALVSCGPTNAVAGLILAQDSRVIPDLAPGRTGPIDAFVQWVDAALVSTLK